MITLAQAVTRHGVAVDEHHDLDALVPVYSGPQRQGDVLIVPTIQWGARSSTPVAVSSAGIAVVRGENGGHTHLLLADGPVEWTPADTIRGANALALGVLMVPEGSTAYLAHPEHAYAGIAPGFYELRRQREQADIVRMVAD